MVWRWSKTAANNATADSSIAWQEGMLPGQVNDSARAEMARVAQWRDDISGAILAGGTSTAYTVSSNQVFDTLAHMDGAMIAFTPAATNTAAVTLNVDSVGAKPVRSSPGLELPPGTLILGTPYVVTYNNSDASFYLQGGLANPYNVPLLGALDYWDTITPNSSFIFPAGQAISRTVYSSTFARWGTTYGSGDGSTTFNVPDKTGRTSVMKEAASSRLSMSYFGGNSTAMGAVGGSEISTLTQASLPNVNFNVVDPGHFHTFTGPSNFTTFNINGLTGGAVSQVANVQSTISTTTVGTNIVVNSGGSNFPVRTVQPTIVCNYIIRII
jgi:microcystin-dependent protein